MSGLSLAQAQKLYGEARQVVAEEAKLRERSGRNILRLASILKELYEFFQRSENSGKPVVLEPRTKGFANFRHCMIELLRPLDLGERSGWYYLNIGRRLLGKIPEPVLAELPFEKVKQLARVATAKGEVPPHLLERAQDRNEPAARLREHVDVVLYQGCPDHSDGPKRSLVLVAGSKLIHAIEEKINRLRPAVTEEGASAPASDAQVVDFALADCLAGVHELEDHTMVQLRHGKGAAGP